jgi:chemotaxis protein methyltransferase CheR
MVERAVTGRFSAEDARTAPPALLRRWFEPTADGGWQASGELRRMVRFEAGDLLRMAIPARRYDLILCRNTVIYFTEAVRDALHERLAAALTPGGYLVVGTSERVADPRSLGLTSAHPFVYRSS